VVQLENNNNRPTADGAVSAHCHCVCNTSRDPNNEKRIHDKIKKLNKVCFEKANVKTMAIYFRIKKS
jgi:hypothetical protein